MAMNRICFFIICVFTFLMGGYAQESGVYHVIGVNGRIVNQQSGKELQSDEQVYLQTMLLFGNASDKAILLSPSQRRYRLEMPVSSGQLLVSSDKSLHEIKSRPLLSTSTRGMAPVSPEMLKNYFGADTFAIAGNSLNLPVGSNDVQKYDLVFRFAENNAIKEVISGDFVIRQSDFGRTQINDCSILLREGENMTPVTQATLCFIDEQNLYQEFTAYLNALNIQTDKTSEVRRELRQYCRDVYGVMDNNRLNEVIARFLSRQ